MKFKKNYFSIKWVAFLPTLALSIILFNCDSSKDSGEDKLQLKDNYEVTEGPYTFFANAEKYKDTDLKRGQDNFCQVETKISKVKREGNILTIEILKPKNCEIKYEIIWDGVVFFSNPMQSTIYVKALADNCNEDSDMEIDALVIKLEEAFKTLKKDMIDRTNFTVRDACSLVNIDCVDDCNVVITF
ncbi:hypothetical protein QLS71_000290 [Mariniflexile litorale]|uniref:Lipoprotein n=1 Tax=Mariniflexile litorale TaxID=3045158 RepID=A0AAU7EG18_9FLAO|nr:hypothetical protein [Mariniflexile sp. KMM 9835]MDQ8212018.1 hypothetical protein [Mariniflexile sp. KMM 9835]